MERMENPERPADACRIYLVRHGTTTMNVENRYRGRRDVPLDAQGWKDAAGAAWQLKDTGLAAVYAGPLERTRDTASVIALAARVPGIQEHPGLVNLDYGDWEGLTSAEAADRDPEAFRLYREWPAEAACPGGESLQEASDRIMAALQDIGASHPGASVAAVSHAVMVRLAVGRVRASLDADWRIPLPRGSTTPFDVIGGRVLLAGAPGSLAA